MDENVPVPGSEYGSIQAISSGVVKYHTFDLWSWYGTVLATLVMDKSKR